jgi:uncharacterized glyoxalase superfamily protein PhnB
VKTKTKTKSEKVAKQSSFKPASYNSVSPYLVVPDAAAVIQFLIDVFDAVEIRRFAEPSGGRIAHAEVQLDDTVVMLSDCAPGTWPAVESHVHVYVADVDATFARALKHGGLPVQEPVKKQDEDKRGAFKDRSGTTWWVATRQG